MPIALDPRLMMLAHDGAAALRDRYELVYRRQVGRQARASDPRRSQSGDAASWRGGVAAQALNLTDGPARVALVCP